jgi:hypothetical protein
MNQGNLHHLNGYVLERFFIRRITFKRLQSGFWVVIISWAKDASNCT